MRRAPLISGLICGIIFGAGRGYAQELIPKPEPRVSLSGQVGAYLEAYSISGRDPRRPPLTARFFFTPSLALFGLKLGLDLDGYLTTEQWSFHLPQLINRIGFNPNWSWGDINLGDFSPVFSELTLNGVQLRGGGVELNPLGLRFAVVGGETQRASEDTLEAAYRRTLYGLKIGLGRDDQNFLDLNILKARDDLRSLPDTVVPAAAPQENLVSGLSGKMSFFRGVFNIGGEIAGCAHTRDLRNSDYTPPNFPSFARSIFSPRLSTRADFAYTLSTTLSFPFLSLGGTRHYIGPGYTSLGLPYLMNDRSDYRLDGDLKLFGNRLVLGSSYEIGQDNLTGDKLATTNSTTWSHRVMILPVAQFSTSGNLVSARMRRDAPSDTSIVDNLTESVNIMPAVNFRAFGLSHNLSAALSFQKFDDQNPLTSGFTDSKSQSLAVNLGTQLRVPVSISLGLFFTESEMYTGVDHISSYTLGASHQAFQGKLISSLSFTYGPSTQGNNLQTNLGLNFHLTTKDLISLQARGTTFSGAEQSQDYQEFVASLSYSRNF